MKQLLNLKQIAAIVLLAGATSCAENKTPSTPSTQSENTEVTVFGQLSDDTIAYQPERIFERLITEKDFSTMVVGKVKACSKDTGNWLTLDADSAELLVEVKDNAFVLPTNLEGKHVSVHGKANIIYGENGELKAKITATGIELIKMHE